MSTATTFYIEFKKSKDQRWHLLEAFVPEDFRDRDPEDEDDGENTVTTTQSAILRRMKYLWRQGTVRDLFDGHDAPFCDRGFPSDLSPGLCAIFDKTKKKIDELSSSDSLIHRDWRWGKSWCSLEELTSFLESRLEKCKAAILSEHTKQISFGTSEKLDEVLAILKGEKYDKNSSEDGDGEPYDDIDEMLNYFMEDELDEIIRLKEFAAGIALLVEFLTDDWGHEIRLVFYTS